MESAGVQNFAADSGVYAEQKSEYLIGNIEKYIDAAVFIDTPLDIALARRILRDMDNASGDEIRSDLKGYLEFARVAYTQMLQDILPSSDYVIDGTKSVEAIVEEIIDIGKLS